MLHFKAMEHINTVHDFESLLKYPFQRKKIIYSINSDFFDEGNNYLKLGQKQLTIDIDDEKLLYNSLKEFPCGKEGCYATFTTVRDYEMHYSSVHKIFCIECKRNFPTYNLLDTHINEEHDSFHKAALEKNVASFNCFVEGCECKFFSSDARNEHVINIHQYPPDFKFQSLKHKKDAVEEMDTSHPESSDNDKVSSKIRTKEYPVPQYICFGRGSQRGFQRKKRTPSSDISMKELSDAL